MSKRYNRAIIRTIIKEDEQDKRDYFRDLASQCEALILAIPDKWIFARIFGDDNGYDPERIKQLWMDYRFISDVIIIDREHMRLPEIREIVEFDTVFYGTEYGIEFQEDSDYCKKKSITMVSLVPEKYVGALGQNALELALKDVPYTKKIVLFGTGVYFDIYMREFGSRYMPAYAIDNDSSKWNTAKEGVEICVPDRLFGEDAGEVLVIICSKNYQSQREQLLAAGDYNYRTLCFFNNVALLEEFLIAAEHEKAYMRKAHVILKTLMKEFDRVCRKYDLKYYIISGSLIGVVRHHGMIPWDDDIDVGMPREDLERLKQIAAREWDGKEFLFLNYDELGNDTFHDLMPRLYYMKETIPTRIMDKSRNKFTMDVADKLILDVYPMDNASDNPIKHKLNMVRVKFLYNLLMGHRGKIDYSEYAKLPKWKINTIRRVNTIGRKISFKRLISWMEKAIQCENKHETDAFFMSSGPIYYVERVYKKSFFCQGQLMDFEDMQVTVPQDYDGLLHAQCYGNYMELPRNAIRKPSHYFNADISIW